MEALQLPSKSERRNRNTPRRANRSPSSALNGGTLTESGKSTTALQARLTYEITSGHPEGGSDMPPKPVEVTGAANETASATFSLARVTCEVYGESGSGTETTVTFTEVDPDPGSGHPEGGSDAPIRSVVVTLRVARQDAGHKAQADDSATSLSSLVRPFTAEPAVDQMATPT